MYLLCTKCTTAKSMTESSPFAAYKATRRIMGVVPVGRAANSPDNSPHAVSLPIIHIYGSPCSEVDHKRIDGQQCLPPRVSSVALPWLLNQKETPRSSDPGVFQSVYPTGTSSYRWTKRITQGGSGSEGPLPGLGIMIGGRMIEPGPGKMLNNTYRIGVPYFLHRETACSLNHEGRRTLTTTLSGTAVESFLASLSPSWLRSQEGVSDSRDITYGCLIYYNGMMARNLPTLLRLCCISSINRKVMGNGVSTANNCSSILEKTAGTGLAASDIFRRPSRRRIASRVYNDTTFHVCYNPLQNFSRSLK